MSEKTRIVEKKYLLPFILITSLFALWGFANDITNPMVAAFKTIMETSNFKASLIQFAFYGGYATMAIPAALFIQKYSYKKGILLGLSLYALGALLFWPAAQYQQFNFFLGSLYILTFGLAFLETTANPFILSLGAKETATQRLNLAQAFNPMGSLIGMFVASKLILSSLESDKQRNAAGELIFSSLDEATKAVIRTNDLLIIRNPYVAIGLVVISMLLVIAFTKMPKTIAVEKINMSRSLNNLFKNASFREGVVAQIFYVAAQIMCWTFIIQYAENLGLDKTTAQNYNIAAMILFLISRFLSTFLMRYIDARRLLMLCAVAGMITILATIFIQGLMGLYFLVATSAFMSLMFPTIYGIALEKVDSDITMGSALLVMAIVGGALMPPLQGALIDLERIWFLPAINASFVLPLISFCMIALYGYRSLKRI